jgi:hypothetical protein
VSGRMTVGELREMIKDLPDDMEVRVVSWAGTCDLSQPAGDGRLVNSEEDSVAYACDPPEFPFFEIDLRRGQCFHW